MRQRSRGEVLNVHLAIILNERGLISAPESILQLPCGQRRYPDVLVEYRDLRVAIEGKIGDNPSARAECLKAANERIEERIADVALAVIYPSELRDAPVDRLRSTENPPLLQVATVRIGKISEFHGVTVSEFSEVLRAVYDDILGEGVIQDALKAVEHAVISFDVYSEKFKTAMDRLTEALGAKEDPKDERERGARRRRAALILLNAFIFQQVLSDTVKKIKPLRDFKDVEIPFSKLTDHWYEILKVNWYPIFHIAWKIVKTIPTDTGLNLILKWMLTDAENIVEKRASLRHDLMGRIYHKLLTEKKFLATYFTSIPAANILLRLALHNSPICKTLESISNARIADIACGTGTLLMAAASAIEENYIRNSVALGKKPNLISLHKTLLEEALYGFDVLPSAVHLTASTLALRAPDVNFYKTNLFVLPYGGEDNSLGSIEFLVKDKIPVQRNLFSQPAEEPVRMQSDKQGVAGVSLPLLDVCVMNPPFTRSVSGNLLFGSVPNKERAEMQKKLASVLRREGIASSTAGLGAVFVAVADRYLKQDGNLALVLPIATLSGVAWGRTRKLWASKYILDWVVTSHDPRKWNFSENTSLSEVLLVLRKSNSKNNSDAHTKFINLWQNPQTVVDAVLLARAVLEKEVPNILEGQAGSPIRLDGTIVGELLSVPYQWLRSQNIWLLPASFAQSLLTKLAIELHQSGKLYLPGQRTSSKIPLIPLERIASIGPDVRDITDGFNTPRDRKDISPYSTPTPFPFLWGHDSTQVVSLEQNPNAYLTPLGRPKKKRPLRKIEHLWPLASRLLVAGRLWLNTHRLLSVLVKEPVLSNVWWTVKIDERLPNRDFVEKSLCLWFNSSVGILFFLLNREQTQGAFIALKKPQLKRLLVPDISELPKSAIESLADVFDKLADAELKPFPKIEEDENRKKIDAAISDVFGLSDLAPLRALLANEPIITLKPLQ